MPKKFHRQIYTPEMMQLIDPNEQHFNANEAHLLQFIADLATEISSLKLKLRIAQTDISRLQEKMQ